MIPDNVCEQEKFVQYSENSFVYQMAIPYGYVSSCAEPLEDELSTEEAFSAIDQMGEIGLKWINLSGGAP